MIVICGYRRGILVCLIIIYLKLIGMSRCMFPYYVDRKVYYSQGDRQVPVPCGKCPVCLRRRLASWSFRLEMESLRWQTQYFLTLTYNTDHVPISENTFLTLDKSHPTNFFKRLRKRSGKLVYYLCGEYGTRNKRPHYHCILFGTDSLRSEDIISSWPFGDVYFGKVEAGSIRYTVQYYDKGDWRPVHKRDDRVPEYSVMSNGIGRNFLTPEMVKHLLAHPDKGYIYDVEGRKIAIPRYYKRRLFDYVGTTDLVSTHPSLLVHRDDMLVAKDVHHKQMADLIESLTDSDEVDDTEERNADRKAAIVNYRAHKRKSRPI